MKKTLPSTDEAQQAARQYIDRVVAISRRHGMTREVPAETYHRAVEAAMRAASGLGLPEFEENRPR